MAGGCSPTSGTDMTKPASQKGAFVAVDSLVYTLTLWATPWSQILAETGGQISAHSEGKIDGEGVF